MNPPMNLRHRQHQQQRFYTASAKHEDLPPQESGFYPDAPGPKERVSRTQFRAVSRYRRPLTVTRDSSQGSFLYC